MEQNKIDAFSLINHWRETFGLPVRTEVKVPSKEEMKLALNLIEEEYEELYEAVVSHKEIADNGEVTIEFKEEELSINEVADAIGDLYFVVTQAACIFGLNPEEIVQKVYESNMSKLASTESEAQKSCDAYNKKGIPAFFEKLESGKYIIKRNYDHKVLKGINFFEPKWEYDER